MKINFNLNNNTNKSGETLIILLVSMPGYARVRKSTGQFIKAANWDLKQQRAKKGYKFQTELNEELDYIEREIKALIPIYRLKGIELTRQALENEIGNILKKEKTQDGFFELAERMKKRLELANPEANTHRMYTSTIKLVREYMEFRKQEYMAFDDFTFKWFGGFFEYCLTGRATAKVQTVKYRRKELKNLTEQSYASRLKIIKTILRTAEKEGYLRCMDYKHLDRVKLVNPDADFIYLTDAEIKQLHQYQFNDTRYEEIRDIFLFMCVTGLRISDIYRYKVKNGDFIHVLSKKTKKEQYIPYSYHPIAVELIKKYKDKLPKYESSTFNEVIKKVCKEAGLKKWADVSAHTGRRSLATNLFKRKWPLAFIMQITGHTQEITFLQYIRMEKYERANHVLDFAKQNFKESGF